MRLITLAAFVALGLTSCAYSNCHIVADTEISLAVSPNGKPMHESPAGTELLVRRCVDTKHYIVPEVVDKSGAKRYVVDGRFHFVNDQRPWECRFHSRVRSMGWRFGFEANES